MDFDSLQRENRLFSSSSERVNKTVKILKPVSRRVKSNIFSFQLYNIERESKARNSPQKLKYYRGGFRLSNYLTKINITPVECSIF